MWWVVAHDLLQKYFAEAALKKFESVWGAMTDFGVDAYWEWS